MPTAEDLAFRRTWMQVEEALGEEDKLAGDMEAALAHFDKALELRRVRSREHIIVGQGRVLPRGGALG